MTVEEKLKNLILVRHKSLREFTSLIDLPNSTMVSILNRGVKNASVGNIIKICNELGISADALADGEIVPVKNMVTIESKKIDVTNIFDEVKNLLTSCDTIMLSGQPLGSDGIASIIDTLDVCLEIAKKKNKS